MSSEVGESWNNPCEANLLHNLHTSGGTPDAYIREGTPARSFLMQVMRQVVQALLPKVNLVLISGRSRRLQTEDDDLSQKLS